MKPFRHYLYLAYLTLISLFGLALVLVSLARLPSYEEPLRLILLILLGASAQSTATLAFKGVHFSVGSAISLATVPLYGPLAGVLVAAAAEASLWFLSIRGDRPGWRQAIQRLGFNVGMNGLAIYVAGLVLLAVSAGLDPLGFVGVVIAWLAAATIADQVNFWLLAGILYLQRDIPPLEIWRDNRWAMPINVLATSMGGGLLAFSVQQFDLLGIAIFFLPVVLSAYAFRLYISRTQEQMAKLEELVALRTQALMEANKTLADLHQEKDAFLAVLTHDMRTPLTSIHGYASLLRDLEDNSREEQAHMVNVILRNEESLLQMVNNILEIQQLQTGAPIFLERENFDLCFLISETVEAIESQAIEKNIRLSAALEAQPIYVNADRQKIRRVITNLVSNAIKYTPENGRVEVSMARNGRYAILDVQDTGYGIPPEDLPYVFEKFRRVRKHANRAIGTGLGLAIVKSLVEAHNGEIGVTSQEGVGSHFTVRLLL